MRRFLRKITARIVLLVNILVILFFLFACLIPYLHPDKWWFTGFLGLLFPYILFILFLFLLFWLFVNPRRSLYTLIALLLGFSSIGKMLALNNQDDFELAKKPDQLRIMTWNVRFFVPFTDKIFREENEKNRDAILNEIKRLQPDVVCFQEFFTNGEVNGLDNIKILSQELGYPFHYFSRDQVHWKTIVSGTAVFSKYPMIQSNLIKFPDKINKEAESTINTDIIFKGDTLRFFNIHLQSFRFMPQDYVDFGKIKNQQDSGLIASKNIFRKMQSTFLLHGLQADFISEKINNSPHPVIICGDLNDVPNSYAYSTIRGIRKDAFLEKGLGIGKTFNSASSRFLGKLPTLRIDYILTDPLMEIGQFTLVNKKLSDHFALVADIKLPKKE
jgi:endonuclease/exonuclease/phosphatase family metal-dependent hydrolase